MKQAFHAKEINRSEDKVPGRINNVILRIGDPCFMISRARGKLMNMRAVFYLYVNDVDAMHQRALEHGAQEELPPADMPYEDRQSGVVDPRGNFWRISKRLVEEEYRD